ncbi:MAG TPA: protein-L-isoaspartate(D-aspartate) O-methyltransferase [Anaerolineae bacterium]|nr:protein-L-isoaspartate(D-aspartate) O-methyltransferase [Anaerolineae bacterium]
MVVACVFHQMPGDSSRVDATATAEADFAMQRQAMVDTYLSHTIHDPAVLQAMRKAPRHRFVPSDYVNRAYADQPLPIGYGQVISQPYIVALMTQLLELQPDQKVLEVGTGSGYQAAVLAEIASEVYTIEIIPELAQRATKRLAALGYDNVHVRAGDGYYGWPEAAPFDAIIVTAAPDHVPTPLVNQLKDGGRLVVPIGPPGAYQTLWCIIRHGEDLEAKSIVQVSFLPLAGGGQTGAERGLLEDRFGQGR